MLASRATVQDARALARTIGASGATVMQATPTLWQTLLADGGAELSALQGLVMLTGGEALPGELARALAAHGGRLVNLYGPTETTIWSAAIALDREDCATTAQARRSAVRSGTRGFMCWTAGLRLYRLGLSASFTLRGWVWRGGICGVRG